VVRERGGPDPAGGPQYVLDVAYYQRAVEAMRTHVSDPVFYLFSDEPDWARDTTGGLAL
jgi:hypothetical protein